MADLVALLLEAPQYARDWLSDNLCAIEWPTGALPLLLAWPVLGLVGYWVIRLALARVLQSLDGAKRTLPGVFLVETRHYRFVPVKHGFRYPLFYFRVALSELDSRPADANPTTGAHETWWLGCIPAFRYNRWALFSVHASDYMGTRPPSPAVATISDDIPPMVATTTLTSRLMAGLQALGYSVDGVDHIELFTTPRCLGYAFNPVSFYFCYRRNPISDQLELRYTVLEVHNTFGEQHLYVDAKATNTDLPSSACTAGSFSTPRTFHVSPFNDRLGDYRISACYDTPDYLAVRVAYFAQLTAGREFQPAEADRDVPAAVVNDSGTYKKFLATVAGHGYRLTTPALFYLLWTYPVTAFLTMPRIVYQAGWLAFHHHLPVYARPEPMPHSTGTLPPTTFEKRALVLMSDMLIKMSALPEVRPLRFIVHLPGAADHPLVLPRSDTEVPSETITLRCTSYRLYTELLVSPDPVLALLLTYVEGHWECDDLPRFVRTVANFFGALSRTLHAETVAKFREHSIGAGSGPSLPAVPLWARLTNWLRGYQTIYHDGSQQVAAETLRLLEPFLQRAHGKPNSLVFAPDAAMHRVLAKASNAVVDHSRLLALPKAQPSRPDPVLQSIEHIKRSRATHVVIPTYLSSHGLDQSLYRCQNLLKANLAHLVLIPSFKPDRSRMHIVDYYLVHLMTANDLRTSANLVNEALAMTVDPPQATQRTLSRPSVVDLTTWQLLQPWNGQALAFTWWLFAETVVNYLGQSIFHSLTTFAPGTDPSLATRRIVDLWPRYLSTHLGPRGWPIDPVGPMAPSRVATQSPPGPSAAERRDHSPDGYGEVDAHVYARAERPAIDTLRQNSPQARLLRIQEFCEAFTY